MFVRNAWYVVARTAEVGADTVLGRRILGDPIVLFRCGDDTVGVLQDRCSHRLARLSQGKVVNGTLQCGYHGARFANDGSCVEFPGQEKVLQGASVRSYPVRERYGLIWVWPGDPALSQDEHSIPDFLSWDVDPYERIDGEMLGFGSDYRLIVDNLLDAAKRPTSIKVPSGRRAGWPAARPTAQRPQRRRSSTPSCWIRVSPINTWSATACRGRHPSRPMRASKEPSPTTGSLSICAWMWSGAPRACSFFYKCSDRSTGLRRSKSVA